MGEVARAIERDTLIEREAQARFRANDEWSPIFEVISERFAVDTSKLYLLEHIAEQGEHYLSIFVWPNMIINCEVPYDGSALEIVSAEALVAHKIKLRGASVKRLKIVEKLAMEDQSPLLP